MTEPVSMRTRFERFPATVKGALVFRGEDRDPHQVVIGRARVVRLPDRPARELSLGSVTITVPPHQDVFVPFELQVAELEPGWYGFHVELELDGAPIALDGDRQFSVSWPRGSMRTGTVRVGREIEVGEHRVVVDRVHLAADSLLLRFSVAPPSHIDVRVRAGDRPLHLVTIEMNGETGLATATAYPVPRSESDLHVRFDAGGRSRGELEVHLD
jgi:hypothetical protein